MEWMEVSPPLTAPPPLQRGAYPKKGVFYVENRPQNNYHGSLVVKIDANVPPHTPPCAMTQHGGLFATAAIAVA